MSKARAAGVLGALILCGLIVLSSLAVAGGDPFFAKLPGAFRSGCHEQASGGQTTIGAKAFLEACSFVVRFLQNLGPFNTDPEEIRQALLDALKTPGNCEKCQAAVQALEANLATNQTIQDIEDALAVGCEKRFSDPAEADQCKQIVDAAALPETIFDLLANLPPLTACQALNRCPLP